MVDFQRAAGWCEAVDTPAETRLGAERLKEGSPCE